MSWVTVLWSMGASACITLALVSLFIWFKDRRQIVHLLFALTAIAVAAIAGCELRIMFSQTTDEFGEWVRYIHVPIFVAVVSTVGFIWFELRPRRAWLALAVCAIRLVALVLNFVYWPNLNFVTITSLRHVRVLGEPVSVVGQGIISARTRIGEIGGLLLLAYAIDASVSLWRRGDRAERARAMVVGGSVVLFVLLGAGHVSLIHAGLITLPYMISITFLIPVAAMGYQLGMDVLRSNRLARDLAASRAQLLENEQQLELAAIAADLGVWRWDAARGELWVSDKGRDLLGLNGSPLAKLDDLLAALVPEDRATVRRAVTHSLHTGTDYEGECRVPLPNGKTRWLFSRGRVQRNGATTATTGTTTATPPSMRGVCFDITSRKEAEHSQVQHRKELAHLSRVAMLGELSGSLAHELNQPLTAILSNAQAAQAFLTVTDGSVDLEEVRNILQDIVHEDRRAREVITRLRRLFQKGEVTFEALDLNAVVLETLKLMNSELINHGVAVRTSLTDGLPIVRGDRVQLQQVLINLLVNASDAMSRNDIHDRKITVSTTLAEDGSVRLSVADNGCGIAADGIEEIFEPFHTTKSQGLGLGLTVCRTILSAHGGTLRGSNNTDRGARFDLDLPRVPVGATT